MKRLAVTATLATLLLASSAQAADLPSPTSGIVARTPGTTTTVQHTEHTLTVVQPMRLARGWGIAYVDGKPIAFVHVTFQGTTMIGWRLTA